MKNKGKNICIIILIILLIMISCLAIYFKIDGDKKFKDIQGKINENGTSQHELEKN